METSSTREHSLRVMKRRATGLLVLVAASFLAVAVLGDGEGWVGYVQATLEAAMVGGLADWFAVTALFRRPLGLPIPHTAVIAERKDAFGATLGDFMAANFLNADAVTERIRSSDMVARVAEWLADPTHAAATAERIVDLGVDLAGLVADKHLERLVEDELRQAAARVPLAPLAARALRTLTAKGRDRALVDAVLPTLRELLDASRAPIRARFEADSPWWLPSRVETRIFDHLFDRAGEVLVEMAADPDHEIRARVHDALTGLADRLETSPELARRAEALKADILADPATARVARSLAAGARRALAERAGGPGSELRASVAGLVAASGRRLRDDTELAARATQAAESAATYVVDRFGGEVAALVSGVVSRWDGAEAAAKLELLLGRDLQFIRVNGTVVGGLAGLVIHSVAEAMT